MHRVKPPGQGDGFWSNAVPRGLCKSAGTRSAHFYPKLDDCVYVNHYSVCPKSQKFVPKIQKICTLWVIVYTRSNHTAPSVTSTDVLSLIWYCPNSRCREWKFKITSENLHLPPPPHVGKSYWMMRFLPTQDLNKTMHMVLEWCRDPGMQ